VGHAKLNKGGKGVVNVHYNLKMVTSKSQFIDLEGILYEEERR